MEPENLRWQIFTSYGQFLKIQEVEEGEELGGGGYDTVVTRIFPASPVPKTS